MRIMTYFGVHLPPWHEEKMGSGQITIRFVLKGTVVSKKNNMAVVCKTRDAKDYILRKEHKGLVTAEDALEAIGMVKAKLIGNLKYLKFLQRQRPVIEAQKAYWIERLKDKGLDTFPLPKASMTIRMYFKHRYVSDTVNKQQTVQDLLVDCGVIRDDDYKNLNPINSASQSFVDEITDNLCFISLSFRLDGKRKTPKSPK
jgi:hypothetical protein